MFLQTSSGLLSSDKIVLIGAVNRRATGDFHLIDYECGGEPRQTRASAEAVREFLDSSGRPA